MTPRIGGAKAVELIVEKKFGQMVSFTGSQITSMPLSEATGELRRVPLDGGFVTAARSLGICLGDYQSNPRSTITILHRFPRVGTPDMWSTIRDLLANLSRDTYCRAQPLILVNGLAEQGESWYLNRTAWQRHFDVHAPGILVYGGPVTQKRLAEGKRIDIEFLTNRLAEYLDRFVQAPPYHLIASSLGAQISVEYAARNQGNVDKLVLICPSGIGGQESLPIMEGARHRNYRGLVESTFYDGRRASPRIAKYYEQQFARKAWRQALFETVRGTKSHSVLDKLLAIHRPTLVICGEEDRIVDSDAVYDAVQYLPSFEFRSIPRCGHAPQLECPALVNRMVLDFLTAAQKS